MIEVAASGPGLPLLVFVPHSNFLTEKGRHQHGEHSISANHYLIRDRWEGNDTEFPVTEASARPNGACPWQPYAPAWRSQPAGRRAGQRGQRATRRAVAKRKTRTPGMARPGPGLARARAVPTAAAKATLPPCPSLFNHYQ